MEKRVKIVVLDGGDVNPGDVDWGPIAALGELEVHASTGSSAEFEARVRGADVVMVNKFPLRRTDLPALGGCGMIGVLATGMNNLDVGELEAAGIAVRNTRAYGVEDVAQHALALLLELCRNVARASAGVLAGEWTRRGDWCYWEKAPVCLAGKTLGLIGFGEIGRNMGRLGAALGMRVLAWSRSRRYAPGYPLEFMQPDEIWPLADVISLHCPLAPETDRIINSESLARMKDGVFLINTARGGLVDERAAADALKSGKLAGLGTDVLSVEPPAADNPLLTAPNVLVTPHIAWASRRSRQNIIDIMARQISSWLDERGSRAGAASG